MESGKEDFEMAMAKFYGQMGLLIREKGFLEKLKEEEYLNTRTEMFMKDSGKIISLMVQEFIDIRMELNLSESGKMIFNMDWVQKNGQMVHTLKACMPLDENKELGNTLGMMDLCILAIGKIT